MAGDRALQRHVERLLANDFDALDFNALFLALRSRSYGSEPVKEIGDFTAHQTDRRNKGVATRSVRDFFNVLRFVVPSLGADRQIPLDDVPASFLPAADALVRLLDPSILRRHAGVRSPRIAAGMLADIKAKCRLLPGNRMALSGLTPDEVRLVETLSSYIVSKPAFTGDELWRDFVNVLEKNKLLATDRRSHVRPLRSFALTFALKVMHDTEIELDDTSHASLRLGLDNRGADGTLHIFATSPVMTTHGPIPVTGAVFTTDLFATDWCEPDLVEALKTTLAVPPVKLTSDMRLTLL